MSQNERGTWECTVVDVVPFGLEEDPDTAELLIWDPETLEAGDARAAVRINRAMALELIEALKAALEGDFL